MRVIWGGPSDNAFESVNPSGGLFVYKESFNPTRLAIQRMADMLNENVTPEGNNSQNVRLHRPKSRSFP